MIVALACASWARASSLEVGAALATLDAAAPIVDAADAAALLVLSPKPLLSMLGCGSVAVERALGVTASNPGEPYDGDGEPYAGGASPRCYHVCQLICIVAQK